MKNNDIVSDIFMSVLMYVVTVVIVLFGLWSLFSILPSPVYHEHSDSCRTEEGQLVCGKEQDELYLTKSIVKSPMQVIDEYETKRTELWEEMTPLERMKKDKWIFISLGILVIVTGVLSVRDSRRSKSLKEEKECDNSR